MYRPKEINKAVDYFVKKVILKNKQCERICLNAFPNLSATMLINNQQKI